MTSSPGSQGAATSTVDPNHASRWIILAIVGVAQLMVVLDGTIVNIALPSAQADLHFDDGSRQWVVTAYALAFGSLLLLGGRLGDLFGRKQMFVVGLFGFAVASALGGAASTFELLVVARAGQGLFGALLAPAALAILSVTFSDPAERGKAFGIFGALAGVGAGIGLLLGGVLTEWLSWRWCLYVNLAFAVPAALVAIRVIRTHDRQHEAAAQAHGRGIDWPGVATATLGLFALVFGFSSAEARGWDSPVTLVSLVAAPLLLLAFVLVERRVRQPLLPLHVVWNATRGGSYFAIAVLGIAMFGVFLFVTYFFQQNLGYSPIRAGFAFMPLNVTIMIVSGVSSGMLLPRLGPRTLIVSGLALAALGMVVLAQIDTGSGYVAVLPSLVLVGIGAGFLFTTTFATATLGVDWQDMGVASAMLNTAQQVGGSVGTALLSTFFANAVADYATENPGPRVLVEATIHGYTTVFWWAAAITAVGAVVAFVLMRSSSAQLAEAEQPTGPGLPAH
ncbi:MFS transporter [Nocardioides dongkuii]|uniref:MFS transporter n=1 Tax=Nocardioides dongkuii TaxID=2760089 RepID=UPI001D0C8811|nr:MFS transporter [Nocardioides dongkuii]